MAKSFLTLLALLASFLLTPSITSSNEAGLINPMNTNLLDTKRLKLSHLRLYWHDITSGQHPTSVMVIPPLNNSMTFFGLTRMIDNPLTTDHGPELNSKCVGRAQGFYASTGLDETALYMSMNFVFTEGKYNGSTIVVQGWNPVFREVRELAVVGGTGLFRFASGYASIKTVWDDKKSGYAVVKYNVYVLHY